MALTQVQGGMLQGSTNTTTTIQSNGTTAITIDSTQNVGIGTSNPAPVTGFTTSRRVLQVTNSGYGQLILGGSSGTMIDHNDDANTITTIRNRYGASSASALMQLQSGYMTFGTGTSYTERMRIDSDGNLIMASNAGYLGLPTNQTMRVPSTGGIGYVGNINSATVFQIAYNSTSAGVQLSSGATSWGTFSDSRLKNITGTYTNALNDIAQIQPVKFTWKSDEGNKPQVGVLAQSVQNVVPEAVDSTTIEMDGTEEYLTVRYTELIPLMIASIQELNAKVEAQAAEIAALKAAP